MLADTLVMLRNPIRFSFGNLGEEFRESKWRPEPWVQTSSALVVIKAVHDYRVSRGR